MNYIKENFGYLILSTVICSIVLIGFTISDEMKASKFINDQNISGCQSLKFPWIRQICLKRLHEKRVKTCYFEECRKENSEFEKSFKSPLLSQIFCLIIFIFTVLIVSDYLKKIFGKFREDNYFTRYIDYLDQWLAAKGLTRAKLLKTGFRYEIIYFLIFSSLFILFWGLFTLLSYLSAQSM